MRLNEFYAELAASQVKPVLRAIHLIVAILPLITVQYEMRFKDEYYGSRFANLNLSSEMM